MFELVLNFEVPDGPSPMTQFVMSAYVPQIGSTINVLERGLGTWRVVDVGQVAEVGKLSNEIFVGLEKV